MLGLGLKPWRKVGGGGAPAFVPTDLANLKFWLKADSLGTADGTAVSSWADSGSGGFTATQGTGANQPTKQTLGGKAVVRFNGTSHYLSQINGAYPWLSNTTMFIVLASSDTDGCWFGSQGPGGTAGIYYSLGPSLAGPSQMAVQKVAVGGHHTMMNWPAGLHIYALQDTGTAWQIYQDGTSLPVTLDFGYGVSIQSNQTCFIGARNAVGAADIFFAGDIAEIICYSRSLSAAERGQVTDYLSAKYAVPVSTFAPTDVTGLVRWYRADSVSQADGSVVPTVVDATATANATQATGSKQPLCKLNIQNGRPVLRFDGVDDVLGFTATNVPAISYFVVGKPTSGTDDYLLGGNSAGGTPGIITGYNPGGGIQGMEGFHSNATLTNRATLVASAAAVMKVVGVTLDSAGGAGSFRGYANGAEVYNMVIGDPVTPNGISLIGAANPTSAGAAGTDIAEMLVYNRAVTQAEALQIMAYLNSAARWQVY